MSETRPITLEEAAKEIDFLLETAITTRDLQSATHWILGNLLMYLDQKEIISGPDFISGLQQIGFDHMESNEAVAAKVVCNDLMQEMLAYRMQSGDRAH